MPHLNFSIGEDPKSSYMSSLSDIGSGLNLGNLEYHQSVPERYPNLVLKFVYVKDLEYVDPFNVSGVDRGKEKEQGNGGVDITTVITYKNTFAVNRNQMTVYLALGEEVACNTIFSCPFLQTNKASIVTKKNALLSGLLGEKFRMEIMVLQRSKE